jgi:hypothetical protein
MVCIDNDRFGFILRASKSDAMFARIAPHAV